MALETGQQAFQPALGQRLAHARERQLDDAGAGLGRVGEVEDIGGAVAALMPGAAWITGQCIEASGGMVL